MPFDQTILNLILAGETVQANAQLTEGHPNAFVNTVGAAVERAVNDVGSLTILYGSLASRPAAGVEGRLYFIADAGARRWTRDNGVSWDDVVSTVINEDAADVDFRVEGVTQPYLFFADASTNRVGVKTSTPLAPMHLAGAASTTPGGELGSLLVTGATTQERLAFGYEAGAGGWIQSVLSGITQTPLSLNRSGGGLLCKVHNVAAGAGTAEALSSGTTSPTAFAVANVASVINRSCDWLRVGHAVSGAISAEIDPGVGSMKTSVGFSLPVASNFTGAADAKGGAVMDDGTTIHHGLLLADPANDRMQLDFYAPADGLNRRWTIWFTYIVK